MTKHTQEQKWKYFGMVLGVTRRLVDQFPDDQIDYRPTPEVRSVQELVAHVYGYLTEAVNTVAAGKQTQEPERRFESKADLLKWMDSQVEAAFDTFHKLTDEQISAEIECWGEKFRGYQILDFVMQEHLHHRGQLTVYLRLLGIKPVFVYDM
jgi:uncharacterized damage-inducible protein DinB